MDKKESVNIYELVQIQAAYDTIHKTDLYFHRKVCRWYSTTFHTPLHLVIDGTVLTWDDILTHYYESYYEKLKHNDLIRITKDFLPEITKEEEVEEDQFIKDLIEADRIKQSLKKSKQKAPITKNPPNNISEVIETKLFDVDDSEEQ